MADPELIASTAAALTRAPLPAVAAAVTSRYLDNRAGNRLGSAALTDVAPPLMKIGL